MKRKGGKYCKNCGKYGHLYKLCTEPITSFGIIYISIEECDNNVIDEMINRLSTKYNNEFMINYSNIKHTDGVNYTEAQDIEIFSEYQNKVKFLMIQRKHSLGFLEFLRGRYNIENPETISYIFMQMTPEEITIINNQSFDTMWENTWKYNKFKNTTKFNAEYVTSKEKYDNLVKEKEYNLDYYIKTIIPKFNSHEWGFPKGRRNFNESNIECALREFKEETELDDNHILILNKIKPIEELLMGTDGITYKHIYYPAIAKTLTELTINPTNNSQFAEIGDIGWFTYMEAITMIRPYHINRKSILTKLYMYIINILSDIIKEKNILVK